MKDLKIQIKIEDNDNLKEAHDLLLKLGFSTYSKESFDVWINQPKPIWLKTNCFDEQPNKIDWCFKESHGECKEITLPQLRDLVVLKRNDVNDRNVTDPEPEYSADLYLDSKGVLFVFHNPTQTWEESSLNGMDSLYKVLKPITKEPAMKEYLRKNNDGEYILEVTDEREAQEPHAKHWIEIPECSNIAVIEDSKVKFYSEYTSADLDHLGKHLIWMRHTHPEELPFVDDEPKIETATGYQLDVVGSNTYGSRSRYDGESNISYRQYLMNFIVGNRTESLNDQYAEIEKVRQSAWQKQEGGSHYKNLKIQPMQYALENKLDYAQANVVKYVTRHKEKNGKEDLLKAIHNLELMIEFYYGDEK